MKNRTIATLFEKIAKLLELRGEDGFKVNAYRKAARVLKDTQQDIEMIWKAGDLGKLPGIGQALSKKIDEYLRTGRMTKYETLMSEVPAELLDLLELQNLGPKTLARAHEELGVRDLKDLKNALVDGSLANLPGMGKKKAESIRKGIELKERAAGRIPLGVALPIVEHIISTLRKHPHTGRIHPTGSVRRMCETVGDIDILVETDQSEEVIRAFTRQASVTRVLASGKTKGSVMIEGDRQVDLRAVDTESYGAALQNFTGSQAHNVRMRGIAREKGIKINEYGIFEKDRKIGGATEEEIYAALGLPWIPPEIREDRGEIEAAEQNRLPDLVDRFDINGDLHVHTNWSDGIGTLEEMMGKAISLGYAFIAICDHSPSAGYAGGLSPDRLIEQVSRIRQLNAKVPEIEILAGSEVDIRSDGSLDFSDDILEKLDIVIASIHTGFRNRVTERLINASKHPLVTVIAHPTGRLLGQREGYDVDLEPVMAVCADHGTALEINAYYERLDLGDLLARRAKDLGLSLAIGTDAHRPDDLDAMELGVGVARRAWLEKKDLLNCLSAGELSMRRPG